MADAVYVLCSCTSLACAILLWRAYRRERVRLVMWAAGCFTGLAVNNILLIVDLRVAPEVDLVLWRLAPALIGVALLLYGLIWDAGD